MTLISRAVLLVLLLAGSLLAADVPPDVRERALDLVESWRASWEAGDIEAYIGHYHEDFRARGMDRPAWRRYKGAVFGRSGDIRVEIDDLEVAREAGYVEVSFDQHYRSEVLEDYGRKTLVLTDGSDGLEILRERWVAYPPETAPPAPEPERIAFRPALAREWGEGLPEDYEPTGESLRPGETVPDFEPSLAEEADEAWEQPRDAVPPLQPRRSPARLPEEPWVLEEIVAKVNDAIITRSDVERREREQEQSLDLYGQYQGEELRAKLRELRRSVIEELINELLLLERAADLGVDIEAYVERYLSDLKAEEGIASDRELEDLLEKEGLSLSEYKELIRRRKIPQRLIYEEVTSRVEVTEDEMLGYYEENLEDYREPAAVELREIVLLQEEGEDEEAVRRAAREIHDRLEAGVDFARMARRVSETPSSENGGFVGEFRRDEMSPVLREVAFSLDEGEFSEPVRTPHGWHILKVERKVPSQVVPFADVEEEIYQTLAQKRLDERLQEYLEDLYRTNNIQINEQYQWDQASAGAPASVEARR